LRNLLKRLTVGAPFILSLIGFVHSFFIGTPLIFVPADSSFHFNLITVNALFGGFLYTNYSLLIGLLDNKIIEQVKNTSIIRKRNSHILKGIIYATISVISGLYLVLVPQAVFPWITSLLINVEITFMVFLIAYFILSLKEMYNLVNLIHKSNNSHIDEEIAAVKKQYFKK